MDSIKPLDVLQHACGPPLIMEANVLHMYPLEDWGYSFWIALEEGFLLQSNFWDIGRSWPFHSILSTDNWPNCGLADQLADNMAILCEERTLV